MRKLILLLTALIVVAFPAMAWAEFQGWGPRVGLTVNPDQVHFGAHADLGLIASHLRFQPSMELGFIDAPDFKVTAGWTFGH
jgi:hypothetical protein